MPKGTRPRSLAVRTGGLCGFVAASSNRSQPERPVIPAANRAIATGKLVDLEDRLAHALRDGLKVRYDRLRAAQTFNPDDLPAGRAYVDAYVEFVGGMPAPGRSAQLIFDRWLARAPAGENASCG